MCLIDAFALTSTMYSGPTDKQNGQSAGRMVNKVIMLLAGGNGHHVALQFDVLLIELANFGGELRNEALADCAVLT